MNRGLLLGLAMTALVGCGEVIPRFAIVGAAPAKIAPETAKIAVYVYSEEGVKNQPDELQAYLTTALLSRGFRAKAIDLELAFAKTQLSSLEDGKYSGGKSLIEALGAGGRLEGDAKAFDGILERTEKNDEINRYEALEAFLKRLPGSWDYNYMLVVHQMGDFNYASYMVNVATHDVVNSFVISGNARGFRTVLPSPPVGKLESLDYDDSEEAPLRDAPVFKGADLYRLSFYIVGLL